MSREQRILLITVYILNSSFAYDLVCPKQGQWNKRAIAFCFDLNKYICLLDTTNHRYTETCDGPRIEIEGYKSTINRNNFDAQLCRPERYQGQDFTTVRNSDCNFKKSKCAQEGQIVAHVNKKESLLGDTQCLCDYTKGYSFIQLPKDKCTCNPSVEDCSCFRELCPQWKLSSDYQCVTEDDMKNRSWDCPIIANSDDNPNDDQGQQNIENIEPTNGKFGKKELKTIVSITLVVLLLDLLICLNTSAERIKCLVSENGHDDKHNESGKTIYPTEGQNGNDRGHDKMTTFNRQAKSVESNNAIISTEVVNEKASENGHDDKHDESGKTIYPTEGQNGNKRDHDEMTISERGDADDYNESIKKIDTTESHDRYNEESDKMTNKEISNGKIHDEKF